MPDGRPRAMVVSRGIRPQKILQGEFEPLPDSVLALETGEPVGMPDFVVGYAVRKVIEETGSAVTFGFGQTANSAEIKVYSFDGGRFHGYVLPELPGDLFGFDFALFEDYVVSQLSAPERGKSPAEELGKWITRVDPGGKIYLVEERLLRPMMCAPQKSGEPGPRMEEFYRTLLAEAGCDVERDWNYSELSVAQVGCAMHGLEIPPSDAEKTGYVEVFIRTERGAGIPKNLSIRKV
ncbi:MAG: hypothetical protein V1820_02170 [archaeon]